MMEKNKVRNITLLRKRQVLEKIGFSSATLWRMCKAGTFPQSIKIGSNSVAWIGHEIDDWLALKIDERDGLVR